MGFPFGKLAKIGLGVGGMLAPGLPQVINAAVADRGRPGVRDEGHDYVAVGLRQVIAASFPEALDTLDEVCAQWTLAAAQERQEFERQERLRLRGKRRRLKRANG